MKIAICTVPLREEKYKTIYPPLGALAVVQALRAAGHEVFFYDINALRPSDDEIRSYFSKGGFDMVGISATVSTSYRFVKRLSSMVKSVSRNTVTVAGGALTFSAEIILRFTDVDYCVIGEGEKVIANLADRISQHRSRARVGDLEEVPGISYLNEGGKVAFTGFEKQLSVDEIQDADYGIIEKFSSIGQYIIDPFFYPQFKSDERSWEARRRGKKMATVVTSRGCVNRCTFCHRWQRGIRIYPVDRVIDYVRHLTERYDVGFISFGDEDFGASRKWTEEFIEKIRTLDILYRIGGACSDNVDFSLLKRLRESGCVAIHYGFESGSDRILKVMEKRSDVELNTKVARWTSDAGIQTVYAMIVGMPGESYSTVRETSEFLKRATEFLPREPVLSVNPLVVLPGAPVYEYARYKGLLGKTMKDEEGYLLRVSGQGGRSLRQLNLTDYPAFITQGWIRCVSWATLYNYYARNNLRRLSFPRLAGRMLRSVLRLDKKGGPAPSAPLYSSPLVYYTRYVAGPLTAAYKNYREDRRLFFERCAELLRWPFRRRTFNSYVSLREFVDGVVHRGEKYGETDIRALRLGR